MTERCPHCDAPLPFAPSQHIRACEKIVLGLLAQQVTPPEDTKPEGWQWA